MRPAPTRRPILRRPPTRVLAAVLLAAVAGTLVHRVTSSAAATVDRWGATVEVWVATAELPVGRVIGHDDVGVEVRPAAFVPAGALAKDPAGRTVRDHTAAGAVLTGRVVGDRGSGVAGLVPDGWRAVAIPVHEAALPLEPGQRVDVVAAGDPGTDGDPAGTIVAADALVVHVADDRTVSVAVPAARVTRVAAALAGAVITLALAP